MKIEGEKIGNYKEFEIIDTGDAIMAKHPDGTIFGVKANFGNASSPVLEYNQDYDIWQAGQYQVASFRHDRMSAIETLIDNYMEFSD